MRSTSVVVVVAVFALGALMALMGCPKGSVIGEPCPEPGEELCEGPVRIRCDGQVFTELAPCSSECLEGGATVPHEQENIATDTTWACLAGAHVVTGVVTVAAGATLTIEPGSSVRIDPSSRIDADPAGRVVVDASAAAPVVVTSNNGERAGFGSASGSGGLNVFATDGEPSILRHLIVERGIHGIGVFGLSATKAAPVIENCTFRDNENFGIKITCDELNAPIPDFAADGNQFFENGAGDVSVCE
ncbi:MAG: hypothetical protein Q8O67_19235 [Deltaproteobacteria bacterium]|nr:hypothetical protein [Deltaproteobacteria bacterium]